MTIRPAGDHAQLILPRPVDTRLADWIRANGYENIGETTQLLEGGESLKNILLRSGSLSTSSSSPPEQKPKLAPPAADRRDVVQPPISMDLDEAPAQSNTTALETLHPSFPADCTTVEPRPRPRAVDLFSSPRPLRTKTHARTSNTPSRTPSAGPKKSHLKSLDQNYRGPFTQDLVRSSWRRRFPRAAPSAPARV